MTDGVLKTIPKEWKETSIGEVVFPVSETFDFTGKDQVHFLNTGDISDGKLLHKDLALVKDLPGQAKKSFKTNDILFSEIRPANKRYMLVDFDSSNSVASTKLMVLRAKDNVAINFIYKFLTSERTLKEFQLIAESRSGTFPQITFDSISKLPLLLPTLPEQHLIADVLSSFDQKIELLQTQNTTLENVANTLFRYWFINFEFPNPHGKPYKSSGGKMIDSEIGRIPEKWRLGKLDEFIGELESGRRPKGGVGQLKFGIPSVGAESINGISNFDFSKTKYVSEEFFLSLNTGIVKDYDILVYKDGGIPGTFVPHFSMSGEDFPFKKFCINEHVFRVQPKKDIQRFFLYLWLNSYTCRRSLQNIGGKAAIPGINSTDFRNILLLVPDESTLESFGQAVSSSFKKILRNNSQIQTLSKIRGAILPKLMNGEVRVKGFND